MSTLKEIIKDTIFINDDEIDMELFPECVINWPDILESDNDDAEHAVYEPLGLDYYSVVKLTDDEICISTHGHFQNPLTLTLRKYNDTLLIVTKTVDGQQSGISEKDFIKKLG